MVRKGKKKPDQPQKSDEGQGSVQTTRSQEGEKSFQPPQTVARSPVSNQPSEPVPSQALYGSPPVIPFPALAHPFQKPAPKPVEKKLPEYTKSPFRKPQPTAGHDQRKEHETQAATTTSKASDEGTSKVTKSFELLSVGPPLPKDPQQPAGNARKQKNKKVKEPPLKDAAPSSVPAASDKGKKKPDQPQKSDEGQGSVQTTRSQEGEKSFQPPQTVARSPVSNQPSEPVPSQALYGSPPVIPFPALAHPFQKPAPKPVEKKLPEYTKSPFRKPQPTAGHDQRKEHETQAATTTSKASDEGTSKVTKSFELLSVGPPLPKDPQQPAGNARKQKNKKVKEPPLKDAAPSSVPAASDKGKKKPDQPQKSDEGQGSVQTTRSQEGEKSFQPPQTVARSPVSNQPSEPVPSQALYGSPPVIPFPALAHPFQKPAPKPVEKKLPEYTKSPFRKPQPTAGHDQRKEHETQAATTTSKASDEGTSKVTKSFESLSVGPPLPKDPQQPAGSARKQKNKKVKEPPLKDAAPSSVPAASDKGSKPTAKVPHVGKALTKEPVISEVGQYEIPKRKQRNIQHKPQYVQTKLHIEVNYLPLTFTKPDLRVFHYDITFNPDRPKGLFRLALLEMRKKHLKNRFPAFDGRKNLYAGGTSLFKGDTIRDTVTIFDPEDRKQREFDITIKLVNDKLTIDSLIKYMTSKSATSMELPQDVIQCTDIALRGGLFDRFIPVGRSFFSRPSNVDLGNGLELWDGFFQSAIMAWKPYLNVDVANKGFPIEQSVINYLRTLYGWNDAELQNGLGRDHQSALQSYIRGLKVLYNLDGDTKRTFKVNGLSENAMDYRFEYKGEKINVVHYYQREKRVTIRYPKLPLLHVGPPQKNIMVPMEFCTIIGRQVVMRKLDERQTSTMVRNAATSTDRRKARIMDNIRLAGYNEDPSLKEFGIIVNTNFTKVESTVFKPPSIEYHKQEKVMPRNGVWRMDRQFFKNSSPLQNWAVLLKDQRTHFENVRKTVQMLISSGRQTGLEVKEPREIKASNGHQDMSELKILQDLRDLQKKYGQLQIVLVIMSQYPPDLYNRIKRVSELQAGVLTQCLKANTVYKMNPMTAGNLLLKINAKIAGVNHCLGNPEKPAVFMNPVMFVGADVTHPGPGTQGLPSISAVAASFDPTGFKYNMLYRLQPSRMEIIGDLEAIMCEHLVHFYKKNGEKFLPIKILYYRDGVSEGQFNQVLCVELRAIRNACKKIGARIGKEYQPGITFLVVQKRHHTRFFPNPRDGDGSKNNNVLAGTIVDREITHPNELDFYLVSHQSIQGTARPTKYHVLWDDNDFVEDDLEVLTYYLCFLFSRCNRSVSYPVPTYYAHLAAFRARAYWDGQKLDMAQLKSEQERKGTIQPGIKDVSPMFFV